MVPKKIARVPLPPPPLPPPLSLPLPAPSASVLSRASRACHAMAAPDLSTNLQEEATCAICLDYFTDPVMTDCGHNFCRECIRRCWGQPEGPYACPECRELSAQRNLRPNRPLAKMAEMARRLHPPSPVPQGVCAAHREPLVAFCADELRLLCAACERAGGHWGHRVRPLQEAADELKVRGARDRAPRASGGRGCRERPGSGTLETSEFGGGGPAVGRGKLWGGRECRGCWSRGCWQARRDLTFHRLLRRSSRGPESRE